MSKSEVTFIGYMLTSTVAERAGKVKNTHSVSAYLSFSLFSSPLLLITH